jgi:hypothetical protein
MNMFYGVLSRSGVPSDDQTVRATTNKIDIDGAPAVQKDAPETGEIETDSNPNLAGLATRQLASQWVEGEQFTPSWIGNVDHDATNDDIIDRQVSSSGTAAAREASGIFGHGSMSYAIGIEPVQGLSPGGEFGNTYFAADRPGIQSTSGAYMSSPPGYDKDVTALVSDTTKRNARYAKESSLYASWLGTAR